MNLILQGSRNEPEQHADLLLAQSVLYKQIMATDCTNEMKVMAGRSECRKQQQLTHMKSTEFPELVHYSPT
jgi:hypothetical protein